MSAAAPAREAGFSLVEILVSVFVFAVIGTLLSCRLPKLHHPDFEIPDFSASDRFYILIHASDEHFDTARTPDDLKNLGAETVALVPAPGALALLGLGGLAARRRRG